LLALGIAAPVLSRGATAAPAVTNPGNVDVDLTLSVLTFGQNQLGMRTLGPARGTVDGKGTFTIPGAGITFSPITLDVDDGTPVPKEVVVDTVALSDFRGTVDPRSGLATFTGAIEQRWSGAGVLSSCPIGPVVIEGSTRVLGGRPYAEATGSALTVDDAFILPAASPGTPGCGGREDIVNGALHLPIDPAVTTTLPPETAPVTASAETTAPLAALDARNAATALPPPVPSVVVLMRMSPAPSAHARRDEIPPPPSPTVAPTAPSPTVAPGAGGSGGAPNRPASQPRPGPGNESGAGGNKSSGPDESGGEENGDSPSPTTTTPRTRVAARYPGLGGPLELAIPEPVGPRKRSTAAALRALPASAVRTTTSGWLVVIPAMVLVGLAILGGALIRSEVRHSRPRSRPRLPFIAPPDKE
jgi:hypothetical protein